MGDLVDFWPASLDLDGGVGYAKEIGDCIADLWLPVIAGNVLCLPFIFGPESKPRVRIPDEGFKLFRKVCFIECTLNNEDRASAAAETRNTLPTESVGGSNSQHLNVVVES